MSSLNSPCPSLPKVCVVGLLALAFSGAKLNVLAADSSDSSDQSKSGRFRKNSDTRSKKGKGKSQRECDCPVVEGKNPQGRNVSVEVSLFGPSTVMGSDTIDQYKQTVEDIMIEGFLSFCPDAEFEILDVVIEGQMIEGLDETDVDKPGNRFLQRRRRAVVDTRISIGLNTPPPDFDVARITLNAISDTGRGLRRVLKLFRGGRMTSSERQGKSCNYDRFISTLRSTYNNSYWDMVDQVDVVLTEETFFSYTFPYN